MKNLSDIRKLAIDYIDKIKKNEPVYEEDIDMFCKLSKVILESLKVEIAHNHVNQIQTSINFITDKEKKLIDSQ